MNEDVAEKLVAGVREEFGDISVKLHSWTDHTLTMTDSSEQSDTLEVRTRTYLKVSGGTGCELAQVDLEDRSVTFVNKIGGPVEVRKEIVTEYWLTNGWCRVGEIVKA